MHLWDLIEQFVENQPPHAPIQIARIPNGDPLPEDEVIEDGTLFWVRTIVAKSEDEIKHYQEQISKRKC